MDERLQNERGRLAALLECEILDSESQESFDDLTKLAANICQTPVAFIGLIDEARQWFKSRVGFSRTEMPRQFSVCDLTIQTPQEIFIVQDALLDERFVYHPMIADSPFIRFYAGVPLVTDDGFAIGTLCVMDFEPRVLSVEQIESLKLLARQSMSQIKLHRLAHKRMQMEEELQATRSAAFESVRLKTAFLTNISHEIRTPLNGMIGMTELLLDTPLDALQKDYAETARNSAEELLRIIDDILDLSKIEAKKLFFEAVDFELRPMLESVIEFLEERAHRKNLTMQFFVAPDTPQFLYGDPKRLRQVLVNILSNAVKFTEKGNINVLVRVEKRMGQTISLKFTVADTGVGIDEKDIKHLFQPFMQIDNSPTRKFSGTGMGLIISKQIVEMMSGEITVESRINEGSKFSFTAFFADSALREKEGEESEPLLRLINKERISLADIV